MWTCAIPPDEMNTGFYRSAGNEGKSLSSAKSALEADRGADELLHAISNFRPQKSKRSVGHCGKSKIVAAGRRAGPRRELVVTRGRVRNTDGRNERLTTVERGSDKNALFAVMADGCPAVDPQHRQYTV